MVSARTQLDSVSIWPAARYLQATAGLGRADRTGDLQPHGSSVDSHQVVATYGRNLGGGVLRREMQTWDTDRGDREREDDRLG